MTHTHTHAHTHTPHTPPRLLSSDGHDCEQGYCQLQCDVVQSHIIYQRSGKSHYFQLVFWICRQQIL